MTEQWTAQTMHSLPQYEALLGNMDALALFALLVAENDNDIDAIFSIPNGLMPTWPRRLVPSARRALLDLGVVECIKPPRRGAPALYRWRTSRHPVLGR